MADEKVRDEAMIAALKRERATYASRGMDDRVAEVNEQLTHYGYEHPETDPPKGRRSAAAGKQTADDSKADAKSADASKGRTAAETAKKPAGKDAEAGKPAAARKE